MLKVIKIAEEQVGYLEKKSNKDLDSKTENAGYNNYTKFARDLDAMTGFYNGPKQGYPWCDVFVDWCMVRAYGEQNALKLLCQPMKSAGAGCTQSAQYYKNAGRFFKSPEVGDQIFFAWGGDVEHTGLVWKVTDKYVYTIEGNTSDKSGVIANGGGVFKKSYLKSNSAIYGYGRPNYALVEDKDKDDNKPDPDDGSNKDGSEVEVTLSMLSKGAAGAQVKSLQALLIKKFGISCGIYGMDGDFGSSTESAVKKFQSKNKLAADGVVGQKTWDALLK